jgi:hypothetical protein
VIRFEENVCASLPDFLAMGKAGPRSIRGNLVETKRNCGVVALIACG